MPGCDCAWDSDSLVSSGALAPPLPASKHVAHQQRPAKHLPRAVFHLIAQVEGMLDPVDRLLNASFQGRQLLGQRRPGIARSLDGLLLCLVGCRLLCQPLRTLLDPLHRLLRHRFEFLDFGFAGGEQYAAQCHDRDPDDAVAPPERHQCQRV